MGSIATVAAAIVAIWTLVALRQDSRDRTRPVIIAEICAAVLAEVGELIVRNVGASVAKNVTFKFDPELQTEGGMVAPYLQRRYSRTTRTFGPGAMIHDVYQYAQGPPEPVPDEFTLTIDYYDTRGRHYTDSYDLSVVTLRDHTRIESSDDDLPHLQRRTTRAVEAIARGVGRR
jgi:hypothetical protein